MARRSTMAATVMALAALATSATAFTGTPSARTLGQPARSSTSSRPALRRAPVVASASVDETTQSGVDKVNEASKKFGGPLSVVTDSLSGVAFAALHAFDDCGVQDAAKNLRVLWTRAFLANSGILEDDVAYELLPESTRGFVAPAMVGVWSAFLPFCDWIKARTEYLDMILTNFLGNHVEGEEPYQVVVIGAGYDTRSLRRQGPNVNFFEVDLPEIVDGKGRLYSKYTNAHPERSTLPTMIGMDLDECREDSGLPSIIDRLVEVGLKPGVPTMFTFEAVLFYLEPDAVQGLINSLANYGKETETVIAFTDSLKGLGVTKPFLPDVLPVFEEKGFATLTHRAQWGGAVHFTSSVSENGKTGLRDHMQSSLPPLINSYAPQYTLNSGELLKEPSFRNSWYAVTLSGEVPSEGTPYATRLWGEPMVIFRDSDGEVQCLRDVCPHRAAPLSMGTVTEGSLKCMYHGWSFGKDGKCDDVPTMPGQPAANLKKSCATNYAVVEHEDLIWVWGGNILEADVTKLPTQRAGESTLYVDTMLDYNVDWSYIVENNLDSPHIYWLHDGSIPPLDSLGFNRDNVDRFTLRRFKDEIGVGHVGKTADKSTTKIVRFDAPNIVRHCGVSGFSEEFHIVPIAPHRTRVLLRQHFPKGPILNGVSKDPFLMFAFRKLMLWWNWNIALEDYSVMQGQAHNIEDLGADHILRPGLGDDLIAEFYNWRQEAIRREGNPYFASWQGKDDKMNKVKSTSLAGEEGEVVSRSVGERAAADAEYEIGENPRPLRRGPRSDDGRIWASAPGVTPTEDYAIHDDREFNVGTWGIQKNYYQMSPAPTEPPVNNVNFRKIKRVVDVAETAPQAVATLAVPLFVMAALDKFQGIPEAEAIVTGSKGFDVAGFSDFATSLITSLLSN